MNVIYLHGFNSGPLSVKGQQLKQYAEQQGSCCVHLPDLNMTPVHAIEKVAYMIEQLDRVALVGSSLGGFYATQLVARYALPAVLINPAMRPWQLFHDLFGVEQMPYRVNEQWTLDDAQLKQLEQLSIPFAQHADRMLVLLQQGDEILDYREAADYYNSVRPSSMIITETQGNHAMDNFADKLPMALQFLADWIK